MNRPLHIWVMFASCAAVLLAAMGWVSITALRLDQAQQLTQQQAEFEERVRLALWRMDSSLVSLLVEESARPASAYQAFYGPQRAYTKGGTQLKQGDVLMPSPLLAYTSSNILLHFQMQADGQVTSPEVPSAQQRALAESGYVAAGQIQLFTGRLRALEALLRDPAAKSFAAASSSLSGARSQPPPQGTLSNGKVLMQEIAAPTPEIYVAANAPAEPAQQDTPGQKLQTYRNTAEQSVRFNISRQAQQQALVANNYIAQQPALPQQQNQPGPLPNSEGIFKPLWLGGALVLARQVNLDGVNLVQGCWLNWPNLRRSLLASIHDLFPAADLQPMVQTNGDSGARAMAALPVKLHPGHLRLATRAGVSPVQISLAIAWGCVVLAALAVAVLLHGTVSLSERRAAFVSAVTHELRTPLTTFKMYSEMLAEGMVPDEAQRRGYLETLCSEANRLSHLVENVLAYARLERGSARRRIETVSLGELLERVKPRLQQRTDQAGMTLVEDDPAVGRQTRVQVDVSAVEQILFNLVDNACKYAAPDAAEKIIHLEIPPAPARGKFAMLRVRDHGQGISAETARRLFQPFSKSAEQAARSAPGVGLGLALCRRLSRSLGGDLQWDATVKNGACFALFLPMASV